MNPFEEFNIEQWLDERSTKKELVNNEWVYKHVDNSISFLVPRTEDDGAVDEDLLLSPLSWLYQKYSCVSIGSSQIMFASLSKEGIQMSKEFTLHGRKDMTLILNRLGVVGNDGDQFFAVEAAWMFAYAIREEDGQFKLIHFDRDFETEREVDNLHSIFDDWWTLVCDELKY